MSGELDRTAPKPETLQIILLDEISGKLSDLIELVKSTIPEGKLKPIKLEIKAGEDTIVNYSRYAPKPFYSCTVYVDSGTIYIGVNEPYDPDGELKEGETLRVDAHENKIAYFHIKAVSDAKVRIMAMY